MNVIIEKKAHVTTIIINRPEVRNAVDPPTAKAFLALECGPMKLRRRAMWASRRPERSVATQGVVRVTHRCMPHGPPGDARRSGDCVSHALVADSASQ